MGYFPNGTSGDSYEEEYCARCIHNNPDKGCAVMLAHLLHNYDEHDKPDSILHLLIPKDDENCCNKECRMFHPADETDSALEEIRALLLSGALQDALLAVEKHLSPIKDLARAYEEAKRNRDASGRPVIQ